MYDDNLSLEIQDNPFEALKLRIIKRNYLNIQALLPLNAVKIFIEKIILVPSKKALLYHV